MKHIKTFYLYFQVDGDWGEVKNVTKCSRTCGIGTQQQWKYCNNPAPQHGGANCTCHPDDECDGKTAKLSIECNLRPCPGRSHITRLSQNS